MIYLLNKEINHSLEINTLIRPVKTKPPPPPKKKIQFKQVRNEKFI